MAYISRVSSADGGLSVKIAYWFTRRGMKQMTGREPANMIEPLEVFAHVPALMKGYGKFEQANAKVHLVEPRLRMLAELKAATMTHCAFCIDIGSQVGRRKGLTDAELLSLPEYRTSPLFGELDRLVLDYAVAMSSAPVAVTEDMVARLREHFDEPRLVELTHAIAMENYRGRFNHALGIGAAGFSEGMVCAVPVVHEAAVAA